MILAAGLTPAWQQIVQLDALRPGEVNRARQVDWCASGKVLNVARAIHHLGGPCKALTLVGGSPGDAICRDFGHLGIDARWIRVATPTRVCTTILDASAKTATELVPNAPGLTVKEQDAFLAAYAEEAKTASVVILIGSLPVGTPPGIYRELLTRTPGKAVVDARGVELLEALNERPFLVKPNRQELEKTLEVTLKNDAQLVDAMSELNRRGAEWVVITDGCNPVYIRSSKELYRITPPAVNVVNPIGCGDCMAAGIAWALFHGRKPLDAICFGMSAAADKVTRVLPGVVELERVQALAESLKVTHL